MLIKGFPESRRGPQNYGFQKIREVVEKREVLFKAFTSRASNIYRVIFFTGIPPKSSKYRKVNPD